MIFPKYLNRVLLFAFLLNLCFLADVVANLSEERVPMDIAIAIDHSGSMGSGPGSKLEAARSAA